MAEASTGPRIWRSQAVSHGLYFPINERSSGKFLAQWELEHIADAGVVARSDRENQAQRLALLCREDAAKAGISSQDLEATADGNLIGNIFQALEDAEFRQIYRGQVAEQEED